MNSKGFSNIEALLSAAILILIVTAFMGAYSYGSQSTAIAGQRTRATFLAEEGLEAARNIRDSSFGNLAAGTYGLAISSNQWVFSGSSDTTGEFTRQLIVTSVDASRKQVTSTVTWQQNPQRAGSVSTTTYLTNWQDTVAASCSTYCQSLTTYTAGTCRENDTQCTNNSETYESGGDIYCTGGSSTDTCCCKP